MLPVRPTNTMSGAWSVLHFPPLQRWLHVRTLGVGESCCPYAWITTLITPLSANLCTHKQRTCKTVELYRARYLCLMLWLPHRGASLPPPLTVMCA